jgi:hypothetical protein
MEHKFTALVDTNVFDVLDVSTLKKPINDKHVEFDEIEKS